MRTYLIDADKNEIIIDLTKTIVHSSRMVEFEFQSVVKNEVEHSQRIYVRKMGTSLFSSTDNQRWVKLAKQTLPEKILNINNVYDVYRGFKPSGLGSGNEGELFTQMPGKIVKIIAQKGDKVEKGQTLLILEAMKMENEIKSGVDGIVKEIHVKEGQTLDSGILLMEVENE